MPLRAKVDRAQSRSRSSIVSACFFVGRPPARLIVLLMVPLSAVGGYPVPVPLSSASILDNSTVSCRFHSRNRFFFAMPSIILSGLSWSKPDGEEVFSNLDLAISPERVGLVGRNGVGKTTLLNIIAGLARPSAGTVTVDGRTALARQLVQADEQETIADLFGVTEAISVLRRAESGEASLEELADADWTVEERIVIALARLGLDARPDTLLTQLSGGQRTRATLAAVTFRESHFLLLDEPTNNLDHDGRQAVVDFLASWRGGAIIVSHDRELLEQMDAIVELTSLGAHRYGGNWSGYQAIKAVELEAAQQDLAHAQKSAAEVDRKAQSYRTKRQARRGRCQKRSEGRYAAHFAWQKNEQSGSHQSKEWTDR